MRSVYKCFASLAILAFLSCGGSEVSKDTQLTSNDDVNTKLEALISLQGDLAGLVQSEYVTCSASGDTANTLIRKICAISQSADAETKTAMLDQIGILSNSLQSEITQLKDSLVDNIQYVNSRIDLINNTLSILDTRMTNAETAITALQSAVASLTRNNYKLIKTLADFPAPDGGGVITLSASTDYEINGIINLGTNRLLLSNGTHIFGLSHLNDGLLYSGTSAMISNIANASITISNIRINTAAAGFPTIFSLTGNASTLVSITNNYFNDTSSGADLGTITGGKTIWFDGNQSNTSHYMTGLTVAGTVSDLEFVSNSFYNTDDTNVITMLTITSGVFTTVRIENNHSISPTDHTLPRAFRIDDNYPAVPTFEDAYFIDNTCSNGFLFDSGSVTSETVNWWFQDNTGLGDSTFYGQMNISTSAAQPTTTTNYYPVRGVYSSSYAEQFTFQYGVIEDNRTNPSPNLSVNVGGTDDNYVIGNILTVGGAGTGAKVKVLDTTAAITGRVTGFTNMVGGTGYTTATDLATSGSATGSGCTVDITAVPSPISAVLLNNPGTGFTDGTETLAIDGGNNDATVSVTVLAGVVSTVDSFAPGTGYSLGTNVTTSGGSGSGFTVDITAGTISTVTRHDTGSLYAPSDTLTITQAGASGGSVDVSTVGSSGAVAAVAGLDFSYYKPGNSYIAGLGQTTSCSNNGMWSCGLGCTLDVNGVTGRLIYSGIATRSFRVSVSAAVTNGAGVTPKTISFALYKGNTSLEIPAQIGGTITPVWIPGTAGAVSPVSFDYIVSMAPSEYIEIWSSTDVAEAYTVTYLQTNISPL